MKLDEFIKKYSNLPVIDTENLLAGKSAPSPIRVQISRWVRSGKLIQIKRGIYLLAKEYRKMDVYEPYLASILEKPSYISLEKALEYHGLIPEGVPVYTLVTTKRPCRLVSSVGTFDYRHIKSSLFWGYSSISVKVQTAFMASAEKALLDLFYLRGMNVSFEYLDGMRLQNIEKINIDTLEKYAIRFDKPGMTRAAGVVKKYISAQTEENELL